jgi:hypothetical protein
MMTLVTKQIPFGGDSNDLFIEQAQVCWRGSGGFHGDVEEAMTAW